MSTINTIVLAIVQGLAELLPISSSAHVIVAEKLLGLDPTSPPMTLLLVMLHTGTMVAVIVYFWRQWRTTYFRSLAAFRDFAVRVVVATVLTLVVAEAIWLVIARTALAGHPHAEIEELFGHLEIIAPALAVAGLLIVAAGLIAARRPAPPEDDALRLGQASVIGALQGLCLPFRGFSRSGATISAGLLLGVSRRQAEAFSFALAVVLTPAVVAHEAQRLLHSQGMGSAGVASAVWQSVLGALVAFGAGLVALRWLSRWLEGGRWYWFGIYCLIAAAAVGLLHAQGY
jgi:undecaprenyl-diphosphatase